MIDNQSTTWGEVCELKYGKGLRGYKDAVGAVPVYGTNGPVGWCDESLSKIPSVIIGRKGAYRGIHFSKIPFYVIDTAFYLVPSPKLDTTWAYYNLLTVDINGMDSGSAIPSTSRDDFYRLPLRLPPLTEQKSIASVLGALDDKIENNRRMNDTLEEMARVIFKSWFVDFDPVHAKAAGNAPAHMDGDTAALFPSSFGDDGLPVGWELQKIEDVTTLLKRGIAPKYTDGGCVVINQKCIRNDSINFDLARRHNQKVKPLKDKELQLGDVLINSTGVGTLGRVATVRILVEPATVDSHVTIVRPNPIIVEPIILGILLERSAEKIADMGQGSTGQTELKPSFVGDIEIVLPSKDVQQVFKSVAGPLREKVVQNQSESQTLSELRDTLLPKLMSGEIRVADAEREVEAVV